VTRAERRAQQHADFTQPARQVHALSPACFEDCLRSPDPRYVPIRHLEQLRCTQPGNLEVQRL
jgi:hypothetical protein